MSERILDWLNDQEWYQELKMRWDALSSEQKQYARLGGLAGAFALVGFFFYSVMTTLGSVRSDFEEKEGLLRMVEKAQQERADLKRRTGTHSLSEADNPNWNQYFQQTASTSGIESSALNIESPKSGKSSALSKELLYQIKVNHVGIRQLQKFLFYLETGRNPIKLRNLQILTQDAEGYLNARVAVSAFDFKESKN